LKGSNVKPQRRSIELTGHAHGALPIPAACRVGDLIATGGVRGIDRASGVLPSNLGTQIDNMFDNLVAIVVKSGGSADTILKVTIFVKSAELRAAINPAWLRHFPDPESRPARHVQEVPHLGGGMLVQCEALAVGSGPG
jgi:2-iminobutanoate/2-iminopropanoate deaminase